MKKVFEKENIKPTSIFLMTVPSYKVDDIVIKHCRELGFTMIYTADGFEGKSVLEIPDVEFIYVTEGNTFELADYIRKNHFDDYIRKQVIDNNATYIGASAGEIYAACSFKEAENFDSNFVGINQFKGLMLTPHREDIGLVVIPHYTYNQVQIYISNMEEIDKNRYLEVLNVANEETLILDCKRSVYEFSEVVELLRKRRIRLE